MLIGFLKVFSSPKILRQKNLVKFSVKISNEFETKEKLKFGAHSNCAIYSGS